MKAADPTSSRNRHKVFFSEEEVGRRCHEIVKQFSAETLEGAFPRSHIVKTPFRGLHSDSRWWVREHKKQETLGVGLSSFLLAFFLFFLPSSFFFPLPSLWLVNGTWSNLLTSWQGWIEFGVKLVLYFFFKFSSFSYFYFGASLFCLKS